MKFLHSNPFYLLALAVVLALIPLFSSYTVGVVGEILIFAIFAMSLGLLVGYVGLMSFAHSAFFGLAAYTTVALGVHLGINGWWGFLAGVVLSAAFAAVVGFFSIRVSGIAFLMLTMAFSQLLYSLSLKWRSVSGGTDGLNGFQRPTLFGLSLDSGLALYYVILVGFLAVLAFLWCLVRSPLGSIFIGIRDNELRMRAIGYPVQRFKFIAFVISGALGGVGGGLYAFFNAYVSTDILHWSLSGDAIVMVVLGGSGTVIGPAVGAAIFMLLKNVVSSRTDLWQFWIGVVFIFSVMYLRQGVWGTIATRVPAWWARRRNGASESSPATSATPVKGVSR
jgi:branched-chain amino acid transport system permease protein